MTLLRRALCLLLLLVCGGSFVSAQPRPAVKSGDFVYVSGIAGGKGDIREQIEQVLNQLSRTLQSSGSNIAQVAAMHVYLRDGADFAAMNEAYRAFWPADPPTRTTIIAGQLSPDARVQIAAVALRNGAERKVILPAGWQKTPNYSYGIQSGNTLFLAGLLARDPRTGTDTGGDITAQTKQAMKNAGEVLQAAGMSFADAVSSRVFITDAAQFQTMNAAYRPHFPGAPPARATVRTNLPGAQYLVEVTLLAVRDTDRQVINTGSDQLPYSSAIRVGNRLYVAGMVGNNDKNAGDAAAQTKQALENLGAALKLAGFTWKEVVDELVYITGAEYNGAVETASRATLGKTPRARTATVTGLVIPAPLVEIMLVAVRKKI
ncbi:MAG: RidA family protein [Blastocatellia bacterium]